MVTGTLAWTSFIPRLIIRVNRAGSGEELRLKVNRSYS